MTAVEAAPRSSPTAEELRAPWALGVALRRSVGRWVFIAIVALEVVNALARDRIWAIEWQWTAYWSNTATFLVCPLAAAVAAGESVQYRRRGVAELIASGRGRVRGQLGRVSALATWVAVAHAVGVLACGASAAALHRDWRLPLLPVLPAFAAVVGAVFLGAAIGWLWPSVATPVMVGLVGAGLLTVVSLATLQEYLRVDTVTVGLSGLVTRPQFTAVSVTWWLALAVAGGRLLVRRGRFALSDALVAVVVLGAATGVHIEGDHRFAPDPHPVAHVCSRGTPILCVATDYQPRLARYAGPLTGLASTLSRLDPTVLPGRFEQAGTRMAGSPPIAGVGVVTIDPSGPVDLPNLALDVAKTASGCASAPTTGDGPLWTGESQIADWMLRAIGQPSPLPVSDPISSVEQARSVLAGLRTQC